MSEKPPMPADELIELICDDGSDYCDGDHPGWVSSQFNPTTGCLTLTYEPDLELRDPECAYGPTTRRFQELA